MVVAVVERVLVAVAGVRSELRLARFGGSVQEEDRGKEEE